MKIEVLPEAMQATAVALSHATGITRPWNNPQGRPAASFDRPRLQCSGLH
ncbi:MAG: hypothetical protein M3N98_14055 [Actinomycetota bacterium]|nr:hypothetical protein [Actinomycetota bacterium]